MAHTRTQIPLWEVPRLGLACVGCIYNTQESIESSLAVKFGTDFDDLDYFHAAAFRLKHGDIVLLLRHVGNPAKIIEVYTLSEHPAASSRSALADVFGQLGIEPVGLLHVSEFDSHPQ